MSVETTIEPHDRAHFVIDAPTRTRLQTYGKQPVPRYTSYPTAPYFAKSEGDGLVRDWLAALDTDTPVSAYVHIPFCREICWYCGCNMKLAKKDAPVSRYVDHLLSEMDLIAHRLPGKIPLAHLHFGGGSPSTLSPGDLARIMAKLRTLFAFEADAEIATEIDPRTTSPALIAALAREGFNRASLGIQEFDADVQAQINRIQPPEMVAGIVDQLHQAGIEDINFDVLYGLPDQTSDGLMRTLEICRTLSPSRFALFGYAHVPWMAKRQRKIDENRLPGMMARAEQALIAADYLTSHGYDAIGLDHFARPEDSLAIAQRNGTLRRNFQGYTADTADTLIGFGTTAISAYPGGYAQNQSEVTSWSRLIDEEQIPLAKTRALSTEDIARRHLIMDLMCFKTVDTQDLVRLYGLPVSVFEKDLANLDDLEQNGLLERCGSQVRITAAGKFFVRVIAARFDAYLGGAKHSVAV